MNRRVLQVVIASPGDVAPEREAVTKVFDEINRGIGRANNISCAVWRWETDAWPQVHPEGPRGAIDRVPRIDDCDLLVGIFWKRFGTPLKGAASGTEHEIRLAHGAWRAKGRPQIMLYFSKRPYSPESEDELDQWKKVLAFRKEFENTGLLWSYPGPEGFEALLREHATTFVLREHATEFRLSLSRRYDPRGGADGSAPDPNGEIETDPMKWAADWLNRASVLLLLVGIAAPIPAILTENFSVTIFNSASAVAYVNFYFAIVLHIIARNLLKRPKP